MEDQGRKMENKQDIDTEKKVNRRERRRKRERIRLIPIWLRLIIIAFLLLISLVAGLMFGYGVIGDGNPIDALNPKVWTHIYDMITGKE